jgi:hypothetical protein
MYTKILLAMIALFAAVGMGTASVNTQAVADTLAQYGIAANIGYDGNNYVYTVTSANNQAGYIALGGVLGAASAMNNMDGSGAIVYINIIGGPTYGVRVMPATLHALYIAYNTGDTASAGSIINTVANSMATKPGTEKPTGWANHDYGTPGGDWL